MHSSPFLLPENVQAELIIKMLPQLLALLCCLAVPESFQARLVVGICWNVMEHFSNRDLSPRSSCLIKQTKPELQFLHLLLAHPLYPGEALLMSRFALLLNIVVMT